MTKRTAVWCLVAGAALVLLLAGVAWRAGRGDRAPAPPAVNLTGADPDAAAAIEALRADVQRAPQSGPAWGRLGMVFLANNFADEAATCLAQAERLDPGEPRWPFLQGVILTPDDPDTAAAVRKFRRAVELAPDGPDAPRLRLAELLLGQGRAQEAAEHFRRLLAGNPDHPRAHLGLGRLALAEGSLEQSRPHFSRAATNHFTRKAATAQLAEVYQRQGDPQAAARHLRQLGGLPDDPPWPDPYLEDVERFRTGFHAQTTRAASLLEQRRVPEAVALLRQLVRDRPDSGPAWSALGRAYNAQGAYADAVEALRQAQRHQAPAVQVHFALGIALLEQGDARAAAAEFRAATRGKPDHALAHYHLGRCLQALGERAAAVEAFRTALRYRPPFAEAHRELAAALAQEGKKAEALAHLREAAELRPADPEVKRLLERLGE
jgi:tetratricopeptide (TPR) repeat protein